MRLRRNSGGGRQPEGPPLLREEEKGALADCTM